MVGWEEHFKRLVNIEHVNARNEEEDKEKNMENEDVVRE